MRLPTLAIASALSLSTASAYAAPISTEDTPKHVGETATVCGTVASAKFATGSRAQSTFLDLDKQYPNALFTAVIFESDRPKFGTPETSLRGRPVRGRTLFATEGRRGPKSRHNLGDRGNVG